ncbi:MAG: maleylpyruvate isomerase family mycothiol-dependent enzyme [Nocardioidaceae bacterium]|nr:maleylpyruvate isomerase family mycothiol-dependent enzyme [Nocardioidaceae bacterium]
MVDVGAAYVEAKDRFAALMGSLSDDELTMPVPACPAWTVQDVFAHHVGVLTEVASGSLRELGDPMRLLDQWRDADVARDRDVLTARQVEERRGRSVSQLVAEWDNAASALAPALSGQTPMPGGMSPIIGSVVVNDVVVHEGDVREALGLDTAPEILATSLALAGYGASFELRLRQLGLPAIAFAYDGKTRQFGDGDATATVTADRTTLVRMLASRLEESDMRALDWTGDPAPFLGLLPEYGPAHPR